MRDVLNCPNCGAPISSDQCEYCGTVFYDFAAIDIDKPCFIKVKSGDQVILIKAQVKTAELNLETDSSIAMGTYNIPMYHYISSRSLDFNLSFQCLEFDSTLMKVIIPSKEGAAI